MAVSCIRCQIPEVRKELRFCPPHACQFSNIFTQGRGCWKEHIFLTGHPPKGVHFSIWSAHKGLLFFQFVQLGKGLF